MVVDRHPDRLHLVEQIGAIPIDDSKGSPVDQVLELTEGQASEIKKFRLTDGDALHSARQR